VYGHQPQHDHPAPQPAKRKLSPRKLGCLAIVGILLIAGAIGNAIDDSDSTTTATPASTATTPALKKPAKTAKKPDRYGEWACDDFAAGYQSALTRQARLTLVDKVAKWAPQSQSGRIAETVALLARTADKSDQAWQIAADAFAQACFDAGWKG
jgi:hypothetical protein